MIFDAYIHGIRNPRCSYRFTPEPSRDAYVCEVKAGDFYVEFMVDGFAMSLWREKEALEAISAVAQRLFDISEADPNTAAARRVTKRILGTGYRVHPVFSRNANGTLVADFEDPVVVADSQGVERNEKSI